MRTCPECRHGRRNNGVCDAAGCACNCDAAEAECEIEELRALCAEAAAAIPGGMPKARDLIARLRAAARQP